MCRGSMERQARAAPIIRKHGLLESLAHYSPKCPFADICCCSSVVLADCALPLAKKK
jgi:hypothetical protein